jgi:uncharacterized membrane protein YkoI
VIGAGLFIGTLGCSWGSLHRAGLPTAQPKAKVALSNLPAPARSTIQKLTAGGTIKTLDKEKRDGTAVYDVEATVRGRDVEYDVDGAGKVLTSQESVPYASLPASVRAAAEKHFGARAELTASKELEGGKTFYEVAGKKGSSRQELKLTDTGQISKDAD